MTMFCPKCAAPLAVRKDGQYEVGYCAPGNMWFSKVAWDLTTQCFGDERECPATSFGRRIGGRWYCPADGQPMIETQGVIRCGTCWREMPNRLWYALIELHPHGISDAEIQRMRRTREEQERRAAARDIRRH